MYIFLLTIFGFLLRLININKTEGLWNDEYVSWFIASTPFKDNFWGEIIKQCHMPLYYLYIKPFCGFDDIVLRLTSVIPSLITIPVMYLVGKEFSKKTGYFCAIITSTLPFLVYYSQEVRFYSILFLFSTLSLLFTIKLVKGKPAWRGYIISSVLILLTHVLGGIYVFLTLNYILYKRKNFSFKYLIWGFLIFVCILPFGLNIIKMLPSSQWWGVFSYTNILFLFSDFFSPILTNNVNAPSEFFYSSDIIRNILLTIPTVIAFFTIIRGAKYNKGVCLVALITIHITAILALCGKIVFITKYNIEILPILILLLSLGLREKFGQILFVILILFYTGSIFTPYYTAKIYRAEGHKLVCDILNAKNPDKIIFTYYEPNRFYRYLKTNAETDYVSKINRFEYIDKISEILNNVKVGEKVSVVFLDSVSFVPPNLLKTAKQASVPEMFITFSSIKNKFLTSLNEDYKIISIDKKGSWSVITAQKVK